MSNESRSSSRTIGLWAGRLTAVLAVLFGVMMLLMGGGHLNAIIPRALEPNAVIDYRLISLISTGLILALPGIVSLALCPWLWLGRNWAFATCFFSTIVLMAYLGLLHLIREPSPGEPIRMGSELDYATIFVGSYLVLLLVGWLMTRAGGRSAAMRQAAN